MSFITQQQLVKFRDLIFRESGLWFNDSKLTILSNRIQTRLKETATEDPDLYFIRIGSSDDRAELETLINIVTTNETYFYRCESQVESFRNIIIPRIVEEKIAAGDRRIRIWSAGCSTGEEPYTLAMCMLEEVRFHAIWDLSIYATDISTEVLTKAQTGVYNRRSVDKLPQDYLEKYFMKKDERYIISNAVKKLVEFDYANLIDAYYENGFDIIFCRNVLIYFKDESKMEILAKFHDSLNDGGYLFLGPTESIRGLADGFRMLTLKDSVAFQKIPR